MFRFEENEKMVNEAINKCITESKGSKYDELLKRLEVCQEKGKSIIVTDRTFPHVGRIVKKSMNGRGYRFFFSDGSDVFIGHDDYVESTIKERKRFFFVTSGSQIMTFIGL